MKLLLITGLLVGAVALQGQQTDLPSYGSIDLIKQCRRVYVASENEDWRKRIIKTLNKDRALEVVNSPDNAEFFIEYRETDRDIAVTGERTRERRERGQITAFILSPDRRKTIVWSDSGSRNTEEFLGMKMYDSGHNEAELTKKFLKALKKARE